MRRVTASTFDKVRSKGGRLGALALVGFFASTACTLPPRRGRGRPGVRAPDPEAARDYPRHVVRPGETVYSIARAYEVNVKALIRLNELDDPNRILPGQRLYIPTALSGPASDRPAAPPPPTTPAPAPAKPVTCRNAPSAPDTGALGGLLWPVEGNATGDAESGGVDIEAPLGAPVWAAAAGKVVFAGPQSGYGLLLVIRHPSLEVMTVYGGHQRLCVKLGDRVRRGQVVGLVGRSDALSKPQLYFEVRRGDQPVPSGRTR